MIGKTKTPSRPAFDIYAHLHSKMKAIRIHVSKQLPEDKRKEFVESIVVKEKKFLYKMIGWD